MKKIYLVALVLLFVPLLAGASFDKNLYYGLQKDVQVKELQEFLVDQGFYSGPITGNYFSLTLSAVKKFQVANLLPFSGYFGPLSREKANGILTSVTAEANQEAIQDNNPAPEKPSTNNDIVSALQAQIAILQKQLYSLNQAHQQTNNQLQKIIENTTPTVPPSPPIASAIPEPVTSPQLLATCGGTSNPVNDIPAIKWTANATGGNGIYQYSWGDDNSFTKIMGNKGDNLAKILQDYDADGNGIAEHMVGVTVKSGNQSTYVRCDIAVPAI